MTFSYNIGFSPISTGTTGARQTTSFNQKPSVNLIFSSENTKYYKGETAITTNESADMSLPTSKGSDDPEILAKAPNPKIKINGEEKNAVIIVDTERNILYHYDENGKPDMAYLVTTGKPSTPTDKMVKVVSHIENYPYSNAPANTKRHNDPKSYGPKIIILDKIDPETGKRSYHGEFIHGNNNPSNLGKHASHGCVRMDNEVIKILASQVKRGDIVIFQ